MDPRVKAFMDSMKGKRVDMIGVGVSHRELIPLLVSKGAKVALCDPKGPGSSWAKPPIGWKAWASS